MLSLGVMVSSFIMLVQLLIDTVMPDQFNCGCNFTWDMVVYVSTLIVSALFYFYLSWKIRREENAVPLHHSNKFHQVVVYLALLLAALSISYSVVDVLQTTFYYGVTLAVFIKLGLIILIFGSIFGYYLADVKKSGDWTHAKLSIVFWWIVLVLILGSIVGTFLIIGSPSFQKDKRFDEKRLANLQWIEDDFRTYYTDYSEPLPEELSDVYSEETMNYLLDPESNTPIEYNKTGANTYELCTTFSTSSNDYAIKLKRIYGDNAKNTVDPWAYDAGYKCFNFAVSGMSLDVSDDEVTSSLKDSFMSSCVVSGETNPEYCSCSYDKLMAKLGVEGFINMSSEYDETDKLPKGTIAIISECFDLLD